MKKQDCLKLYEILIGEEQFFINDYHTRLSFYMGLVTATVAGMVAGMFASTEWYQFAVVSVGAIILILISFFANDGISRSYRRALETITMKTKIEILIGLTIPQIPKKKVSSHKWSSEPIIPIRYLINHNNYDASEDFVNDLSKKGYLKTLRTLFWAVRIIGLMLFGLLLYLTYVNF